MSKKRRDGRLLLTIEPFNALIPFIMKTKNDASNLFKDSVEITEAERFLRQKRKNGCPGIGFLHLFVAAYVRVIAEYPGINRFVSGQRIYARSNILFIMTAKKQLKADAPETALKVVFDPHDTIDTVYAKLESDIQKIKNNQSTESDDISGTLIKLPRLLLKFVIFILGLLDYFGKMPKSILDMSPFHGSVAITDLGSIGLPPIYHHLYDFGNLPIFISFGAKRKISVADGESSQQQKYIDYSIVMDERICDGFYFSQAFRLFKSILRNPQLLDSPPEKVVRDID